MKKTNLPFISIILFLACIIFIFYSYFNNITIENIFLLITIVLFLILTIAITSAKIIAFLQKRKEIKTKKVINENNEEQDIKKKVIGYSFMNFGTLLLVIIFIPVIMIIVMCFVFLSVMN